MTPAARIAAAIDILDRILAGAAAEQTLTSWGRSNRFAGSKDRAAIRDHVFDGLRNLSYYAALGGSADAPTGRSVMLGAIWASGEDPAMVFTGEGHAPKPLTEYEHTPGDVPDASEWNLPPWLAALFKEDLGADARPQALALRGRAPVTLRANLARTSRDGLAENLRASGYDAQINPLCDTAVTIKGPARGLTQNESYLNGLFEMQDASSQAIIAALPDEEPTKILDYCAGGGGKTLALAARFPSAKLVAHDAAPERMRDLQTRTQRTGAKVHTVTNASALEPGSFDLVLLDVPCSGSGSWRRAPDAKWRFTPERLQDLNRIQASILHEAKGFVAPGGVLAYATCSVLRSENNAQVDGFLSENTAWTLAYQNAWPICDHGDGFFLAVFKAPTASSS